MGVLVFNGQEYEFDDRVLLHLEKAILRKLVRREALPLTWDQPDGRAVTLWISPTVPLTFQYSESSVPELNPLWVGVLERTANQQDGMRVISEEEAESIARSHPSLPHNVDPFF